ALLELVQHQAPAVGPETVGQDDVRTRIDKRPMQALDPIGMLGVPEFGRIARGQAHGEKVGAGRAVRQQRPAFGQKRLQHVRYSRRPPLRPLVKYAPRRPCARWSGLGPPTAYLYSQSRPTPTLEPPLESTLAWSLT